MNRNSKSEWMWTMAAGLAVVPMTMSGCSKPPPPAPPPAQAEVYIPPAPPQADVAALMQEMGADKRVLFPEEVAPIDVEYARAIISFASSFAQGDEESLGGMLDLEARGTLDAMVESGVWFDETDSIEAIRVVYLTEPVEGEEQSFGGMEEMGGLGGAEDFGAAMEGLMDGSMTAESMRDESLAEIRDEGLTVEDILESMSLQAMAGMSSISDMSAIERQGAEAMFGADFITTIEKLEVDMAELEAEFAQGNMTPEDLVNAMYDRGIYQDIVDMMASLSGGLGALMEQAMGQAFQDMGAALGMGSGGADLRIAIQKPGAAFALSFTAVKVGSGYVFSPAPELGDIRVRASDFSGKSAGIGSFGEQLGGLDFGNLPGNPDGTPSDGGSTQGGGGPSPTRPTVPTGPGPSQPGG